MKGNASGMGGAGGDVGRGGVGGDFYEGGWAVILG